MVLDLCFNAKVEDAEINGINEYLGISKDYDIETGRPTAYIDYELQPEARDWGIKSISIVPNKIRCSIDWEIDCWEMSQEEIAMFVKAGGKEYGSGYNHTVSGTIGIETNCVDEWTVDNETEFQSDGAVSIDNVIIDLSDRTITLSQVAHNGKRINAV